MSRAATRASSTSRPWAGFREHEPREARAGRCHAGALGRAALRPARSAAEPYVEPAWSLNRARRLGLCRTPQPEGPPRPLRGVPEDGSRAGRRHRRAGRSSAPMARVAERVLARSAVQIPHHPMVASSDEFAPGLGTHSDAQRRRPDVPRGPAAGRDSGRRSPPRRARVVHRGVASTRTRPAAPSSSSKAFGALLPASRRAGWPAMTVAYPGVGTCYFRRTPLRERGALRGRRPLLGCLIRDAGGTVVEDVDGDGDLDRTEASIPSRSATTAATAMATSTTGVGGRGRADRRPNLTQTDSPAQ